MGGLKQQSFISEQEIMNVYLLQDKPIKERPKYMKQLTMHDIFKEIARKHEEQEAAEMSTLDNSLPSTSSQPDVLSPASTFPPQVKSCCSCC